MFDAVLKQISTQFAKLTDEAFREALDQRTLKGWKAWPLLICYTQEPFRRTVLIEEAGERVFEKDVRICLQSS